MKNLHQLSIFEMREGLLSKNFSSTELVTEHLKHIKASNENYNSFITICEEQALKQAAEIDKNFKADSPLLAGIPVAIKDMIVTEGIETTCASKILKGFIPPYESTVVGKLRAAGAVIVGKTNLDEFAMGSSNENSAFGPVKNPWDLTRVSGGSSGGSAVAVCAGQAPISLGTDTGGSVRQPASFTGTIGLKPTYGRVSRYGVVAYASSCDQVGPFARTVKDLALCLQTISGFDNRDSTSMNIEVPNYLESLTERKDLNGLRVGVPREFIKNKLKPDIENAFENSLRNLEKLGAKIVDINLPNLKYAVPAYYILVSAEASSNLSRYDGVRFGQRTANASNLREMYVKTRGEGFGKEVKRRIMMGTFALASGYYEAYYLKAQKLRTLILNDFKTAFSSSDLIATPTSPTTAFKIGEKHASPIEMFLADIFTVPANLAGLPAISVPCGLDSEGLPIGLQLHASAFKEDLLLNAANLFLESQPFQSWLEQGSN